MIDQDALDWYAWEADRALDRNDLKAHEYWARLYHRASSGGVIVL